MESSIARYARAYALSPRNHILYITMNNNHSFIISNTLFNDVTEGEQVTGTYREGEKEGDTARKDNALRRKVLSAEEEALRERSWTLDSMHDAVMRARDLFLR